MQPQSPIKKLLTIVLCIGLLGAVLVFLPRQYQKLANKSGQGTKPSPVILPTPTTPPSEPGPTTPADYGQIDTLIVMGDSISVGHGAVSKPPYKLQVKAAIEAAQNRPITTLLDMAVGGSGVDELARLQTPAVVAATRGKQLGNTVIVMTIGGNDAKGARTNDSYKDELSALGAIFKTTLNQLSTLSPSKTLVLFANVYNPTDAKPWPLKAKCYDETSTLWGPTTNAAITYENNLFATIQTQVANTKVVDLNTLFMGHGYGSTPKPKTGRLKDSPNLWFFDCVHPNDSGHTQIAQMFLAELAKATVFK